ncbi:MAG: hypothetical protein QOF04_1602, partial [Solirubrobacteraceae bacterium]|nr:hypothetical protein [Solirubrobacteraceae bacterium]
RFPDLSTDLPLLAVAVGSRERVLGALEDVDAVVSRGLVTLEATQLATGGDLGGAVLPARGGGAGRLTLFCRAGRGRRAYREAVAVLRRRGARTVVVLPGVDGALGDRRGHAGLFGGSADTPVAVVALGPPTALRDALPALAELLPRPVATLDTVALVKHEGRLLQPLPGRAGAAGDRDAWQAVQVVARRAAQVGGEPQHHALTRRLREAGAAGATTIVGDWGFLGEERPHGDRLGRVTSHRPACTTCIDRPERLAELWPLIDEVTAEHGTVTALPVLGYRERSGDTVHGRLEPA